MTVDDMQDAAEQERLRRGMVDRVVEGRAGLGATVSPEVQDALRRVKRHLFVPDVSVQEA